MNENMKNFQYIKALDIKYLNSSLEFKEIVLSLKDISAENQAVVKRRNKK